MLIRFGLSLDALQPDPPATEFGAVTLGPLGLLGVLETQLGLPAVVATPADVLMAYRACLAAADHERRFYHASFALDPINVSRTLLDWRELLYEHGWDGHFAIDAPARLRDLADVEQIAIDRVPPCRGQRVRRATQALAQLNASITMVELLDDIDELPQVWRALINALDGRQAAGVTPLPQAPDGSDLHTLQCTLAELAVTPNRGAAPADKIRLSGDGSVLVVRGASRDITAQAVAELVISARAAGLEHDGALLIAQRDGIVLDNACERAGLPRAGFQHYSRFRAVTQVLKLALSLIWRPVSPQLLLQFLIHPVGPLPRHVRDDLADAVAQQPGIGGRKWREALQAVETRMREQFGADAKAIAVLQASIDNWLGGERFEPAAGAPIAALSHRTQLCSSYLAIRMNAIDDDADRGLYAHALAQSEALLRALRSLGEQGQARVHRIELDRLIDEVTGVAGDPNTFAQARHVRATTDPANVTRPWQRIYWWDLAPPMRDFGYPWSRSEVAWLCANGVALVAVDELLSRRTRQWLRPVLNAREQLTLIVHDSEQGYHPLWTQIDNLFDGFVEVRIDAALLRGAAIPAIGIQTRALALNPLPTPRRWWTLPPGVAIARREVESYSSLSKLFDAPHGYVLRYAARLRPGRAQDLADDNRLYGNLAHALFEGFFDDNPLWTMLDVNAARDWFAKALPALIETEGAVLLEPGRGVDKQRVSTTLERALIALIEHLRSAGIDSVRSEFHCEAPFRDIRLGGDIDLLLTDLRGREVVLDVKWGSETYRAQALRSNRQLQLALYAYLRRTRQRWPQQAYFVVESGHVLAHDASVFPSAAVHPAADGEAVDALWERVEATYQWRWRQFDSGRIEINVADTQPTVESVPPEGALERAADPDRFDDFINLTGWADHQ